MFYYFLKFTLIIKAYYKIWEFMTKKMMNQQGAEEEEQQLQDQLEVDPNYYVLQSKNNQQEQILDEQDELRQQVAFHLDYDQLEVTQEQKLAFQYMKMVKQQKQQLKQTKKNVPQDCVYIQEQTKANNSIAIKDKAMKPNWFQQFQQQALLHWNCVVQNIKFLISKHIQYQQNDRRKNKKFYQSIKMKQTPMVYELIKLTVGEVEQLMQKFSKEVHQALNQNEDNCDMIKNYCMWICSLTALHQAWANYKHFQQIGQINSVITQLFKRKLHLKNQSQILTSLVILITHFQQNHMQKMLQEYFDQL